MISQNHMKALIWIIILVVIIGGGYWLMHRGDNSPYLPPTTNDSSDTSQTTNTPVMEDGTIVPKTVTVIYTDSGFSPKSVNISVGDSIKFINNSSKNMWVASDPHPVHTGYDGTSTSQHCVAGYTGAAPFDQCASGAKGASYTFTFSKPGSFGFHNHNSHSDTGTVVVQ